MKLLTYVFQFVSLVLVHPVATRQEQHKQPDDNWNHVILAADEYKLIVLPTDPYLNSSHVNQITMEYSDRYSIDHLLPEVVFDLMEEGGLRHLFLSNTSRSIKVDTCPDKMTGKVIVSAFARQSVEVRIKVAPKRIQLNWGEKAKKNILVSPSRPVTMMIPVKATSDVIFLKLESPDGVCALVGVSAQRCPLKDNEYGVKTAEVHFTILGRGSVTLTSAMIDLGGPLYVYVVIPVGDGACRLPDHLEVDNKWDKLVVITILGGNEDVGYTIPLMVWLVALAFVLITVGSASCFFIFCERSLGGDALPDVNANIQRAIPEDSPAQMVQSSAVPWWKSIPEYGWKFVFRGSHVCGYLSHLFPTFLFLLVIAHLLNQREAVQLELCYLNYLCDKPYNHLLSNLSYIICGFFYTGLVMYKARKANNDDESCDRWGVHYALGLTLICQGILSIVYHDCPNNFTLLLDTPMMYAMFLLRMVKMFQQRNPQDGSRGECRFVFVLTSIVALEYLAVHFGTWFVYVMWSIVYCIFMTWVAARYGGLDQGKRYYLLPVGIFIMANVGCLIYAIVNILNFPTMSLSGFTRIPLVVNLTLYTIYFLGAKIRFGTEVCAMKTVNVVSIGFNITSCLMLCLGLYFYLGQKRSDRNLSSAESRELNAECDFLDYFDAHDLWHFLSAAAVFLANLSLLIQEEKRQEAVDKGHWVAF